jgi:hypothetical protein
LYLQICAHEQKLPLVFVVTAGRDDGEKLVRIHHDGFRIGGRDFLVMVVVVEPSPSWLEAARLPAALDLVKMAGGAGAGAGGAGGAAEGITPLESRGHDHACDLSWIGICQEQPTQVKNWWREQWKWSNHAQSHLSSRICIGSVKFGGERSISCERKG